MVPSFTISYKSLLPIDIHHNNEKLANMRYSIPFLLTFIACFSSYVSAAEYKGPLEDVLKEKLGLTKQQFVKMCASKPLSVGLRVSQSQATAEKLGNDLADDSVKRAKKLPKVENKDWDEIVDEHCRSDPAVKVLTEMSINKVNLCLDPKDQLRGDKRMDFTEAIFKGFCNAVETLAKQKYEEDKN